MSKRTNSELTFDSEEDSDLDEALLSGLQAKKKRKVDEDDDDDQYVAREEDFDDPYDDKFYGDDADREYLDSLEEVEREQILYDRFEQRNKLKIQRERLKREGKLKPRANSGQRGQTKRKGTEQTRSTAEKKQQSLSDIRARRQANKDKGGPKPPPRSEIPDIDVDRNRGRAKATQKSSESSARATVNIQQHHLQHIVIKRSNLEAWFREAYFENLVTGCFARVLVGQDRGNKVYRLAQVKGVGKAKSSYTFCNQTTTKNLILQLGSSSKPFRMELISNNAEISPQEFSQWSSEASKANDESLIPTEQFIRAKAEAIANIHDFVYDDKAIDQKLAQNAQQNKSLAGLSKNVVFLQAKYRTAQDNGETELAEQLAEELEQAKQAEMSLRKKLAASSKIDVNAINRKNRNVNVEVTKQKEKKGDKKDAAVEYDPFARRAQTHTSFFQFSPDASPLPSPKGEVNIPSNSPFDLPSPGGLLSPGGKSFGNALIDAHMFAAAEVNVDLSVLPPPLPPLPEMNKPEKQPHKDNKKTVSLSDYLRRIGKQ